MLPSFNDIPPYVAVTVAQHCQPIPGWPELIDTRFIGATPAAADLYGYDSPEKFVGRFISETRPLEHERIGQDYSYARRCGRHVSSAYAAVIERPDGEVILTHKVTQHVAGKKWDMWITYLEETTEGEPAAPPDLEALGLSVKQRQAWAGHYTVREFLRALGASQTLSASNIELPEKLRYSIEEIGDVRKVLNGEVTICVKTGTWRYKQACFCGWEWGSKRKRPAQCPACHNDYPGCPPYTRRAHPVPGARKNTPRN